MANELMRRVLVAAVGIPVAAVAFYLGGWVLAALLAVLAALAAEEFYRLSVRSGARPFATVGIAAAAVAPLMATVRSSPGSAGSLLWTLVLLLLLGSAAAAVWRRDIDARPASAVALTVVGFLYTGGTLSYAVFLRSLPLVNIPLSSPQPQTLAAAGAGILAFPIALTWICDSLAYFAGRRWGRRKLMPAVSPGKTVVGAIAGLVGAVVAGVLLAHFALEAWLGVPLGVVAGAGCGLVVALVGQVGDLAESLLKREAGVKDSGTLLPGHGGILDRLDALFLVLPVSYWYLSATVGVAFIQR
jgi:phosphatidate cytidylyltransferase